MDVEMNYVMEPLANEMANNPEFANVLERFGGNIFEDGGAVKQEAKVEKNDYLGEDYPVKETTLPLSRKKKKAMNRISVADLKKIVSRPDVVETHDANSRDPRLLVYLKSYRNTVPVPNHWILKRKYLANKLGIEKSQYKLPDYVEATGISKMREALGEAEDKKSMKQKQREKVRPKLGRVSLDFKMLHDAFFKYQKKSSLSLHGETYYEGKEYEIKSSRFKPGRLSDELKEALGITSRSVPPPWLQNMQRYGPPPSYPNLKIAGLNAPIPSRDGAEYGHHPGGWGKPPVDEKGIPLFGDPYGVEELEEVAPIKVRLWGQMEEGAAEEGDDEDEVREGTDEDEVGEEGAAAGGQTQGAAGGEAQTTAMKPPKTGRGAPSSSALQSGMMTVSAAALNSVEEHVELRKKREGIELSSSSSSSSAAASAPLYQHMPQIATGIASDALFPSMTKYAMPSSLAPSAVSVASSATTNAATAGRETEGDRLKKQKTMELEKQYKSFKF